MLEVSNLENETRLREMNLSLMHDILGEDLRREHVYWDTIEGITSTHLSSDVKS